MGEGGLGNSAVLRVSCMRPWGGEDQAGPRLADVRLADGAMLVCAARKEGCILLGGRGGSADAQRQEGSSGHAKLSCHAGSCKPCCACAPRTPVQNYHYALVRLAGARHEELVIAQVGRRGGGEINAERGGGAGYKRRTALLRRRR